MFHIIIDKYKNERKCRLLNANYNKHSENHMKQKTQISYFLMRSNFVSASRKLLSNFCVITMLKSTKLTIESNKF